MDIVITYVDGNDPVWREDYEKYTRRPLLEKRFRDWGTLKYLMRGIEKNMPFVGKVYLVVSHESQVPSWANREKLHIVLHRDFIPESLLPTFNCNPIETHFQNIPGLDEQFLYFNDDLFPVMPCRPEWFFAGDKVRIGMSGHILCSGMFRHITKTSDRLARKALNMKPSCVFMRPQHSCTPMLKSEMKTLYGQVGQEILSSQTMVRDACNVNQYVFTDYLFYKGKVENSKLSKKHISLGATSVDKVKKAICSPDRALLCLNDVQMSSSKFEKLRNVILDSFESRFPEKSSFEI